MHSDNLIGSHGALAVHPIFTADEHSSISSIIIIRVFASKILRYKKKQNVPKNLWY